MALIRRPGLFPFSFSTKAARFLPFIHRMILKPFVFQPCPQLRPSLKGGLDSLLLLKYFALPVASTNPDLVFVHASMHPHFQLLRFLAAPDSPARRVF